MPREGSEACNLFLESLEKWDSAQLQDLKGQSKLAGTCFYKQTRPLRVSTPHPRTGRRAVIGAKEKLGGSQGKLPLNLLCGKIK